MLGLDYKSGRHVAQNSDPKMHVSLAVRLVNRLFPRRPPIAPTLLSWLEGTNYAHSILEGSGCIRISRPAKVLCGSEDDAGSGLVSCRWPRALAAVCGCTIRGRDGYVVLPDGSYLMENTNEKWLFGNPAYFQRIQPLATRVDGPVFSLMGMHCREHYHWLHDSLTLLHRVLDHLPEDIRFLVPDRLPQEKVRLLEAFGIDDSKILIYDPERPLAPEVLYLATPAAPHRLDDPAAIGWVRDRLHAYFDLKPRPERRLFISRETAATRRISNMSEIAPILSDFGFEIIRPELLSLVAQAELFAQAAVIAGPHGAAHTNMMFADPDCKVLDIFADEVGFRTYYASLARVIGMSYHILVGRSLVPAYDPEEMILDLPVLRKSIEDVLQAGSDGV